MTDGLTLLLSGLAGVIIGLVFFAVLWWTVRHVLTSARPGLWQVASILARMSFAVFAFYLVGGQDWQRLLVCLVGFVIGRMVVLRTLGSIPSAPAAVRESGHALEP